LDSFNNNIRNRIKPGIQNGNETQVSTVEELSVISFGKFESKSLNKSIFSTLAIHNTNCLENNAMGRLIKYQRDKLISLILLINVARSKYINRSRKNPILSGEIIPSIYANKRLISIDREINNKNIFLLILPFHLNNKDNLSIFIL